jgi:hypothetical protein
MAATLVRGWRAGAGLVRGEERRFEMVISGPWVWRSPGGTMPGQSRNRSPIAMAVITADFGYNVGVIA